MEAEEEKSPAGLGIESAEGATTRWRGGRRLALWVARQQSHGSASTPNVKKAYPPHPIRLSQCLERLIAKVKQKLLAAAIGTIQHVDNASK